MNNGKNPFMLIGIDKLNIPSGLWLKTYTLSARLKKLKILL